MRYVLTGTPGSGKTAVLRLLETRGYEVVEESATAVIALRHAEGVAEPWRDPAFIESILAMQQQRQLHAAKSDTSVQFFDRSPICTYALAVHLGRPIPDTLTIEIERLIDESFYARKVFFVRNLGHVEPTAARRISYEDALAFERTHEHAYRDFGYDLIDIPPGDLAQRATQILNQL